jgi:hypothetical protein
MSIIQTVTLVGVYIARGALNPERMPHRTPGSTVRAEGLLRFAAM